MGVSKPEGQIAAFFDVDLTITNRDSFRYFLEVQYLHNFYNWHFAPLVFVYGIMKKMKFISLQSFKERALISFIGKTKSYIQEEGSYFTNRYLLLIIRSQALRKIRWHKKEGHLVYIATSSPDIYIKHLSEYLKCDGYECSRLAYRDNSFIGKFEGRDCLGHEKLDRLRIIAENLNIDIEASFGYADQESDIPLLEWVGFPTAVSPTSPLRKTAMHRGWKIEVW